MTTCDAMRPKVGTIALLANVPQEVRGGIVGTQLVGSRSHSYDTKATCILP